MIVIDGDEAGNRPVTCVWTKSFALPGKEIVWNPKLSTRTFEKDISILNVCDYSPN